MMEEGMAKRLVAALKCGSGGGVVSVGDRVQQVHGYGIRRGRRREKWERVRSGWAMQVWAGPDWIFVI